MTRGGGGGGGGERHHKESCLSACLGALSLTTQAGWNTPSKGLNPISEKYPNAAASCAQNWELRTENQNFEPPWKFANEEAMCLCPGWCDRLGPDPVASLGFARFRSHVLRHAGKAWEVVPCQGVLGVDFVAEDSTVTLDWGKEEDITNYTLVQLEAISVIIFGQTYNFGAPGQWYIFTVLLRTVLRNMSFEK